MTAPAPEPGKANFRPGVRTAARQLAVNAARIEATRKGTPSGRRSTFRIGTSPSTYNR